MRMIQQTLHLSWVKSCLILALLIAGAVTANAATYYVATNGSDGNTGTSTGSPWRHIYYAASKALAGDTVYIKGGNYGNEKAVVTHSGSSGSPITFEGYSGTVRMGTLPSPRTNPASTEIGIKMVGRDYITLRNIDFTWYYECVWVEDSHHVTLDDLYIDKCGSTGASGDGIYIYYSDYATITDCTVRDCGGNNVYLNYAQYCLIDNLSTLGTLAGSDTYATDYYCVLRRAIGNTIQNSIAEDTVDSSKGNHGFIIKDATYTPNSRDNVFQDCTAISFEECFSVAHYAYNNTFLRCSANNTAKTNTINTAFMVRNSAYNNTFRECDAIGRRVMVGLTNYAEGNTGNKDGNQFINCRFRGIDQSDSIGVLFWQTTDTIFENCIFDKVNYFGRYVGTNTGTIVKNCIINDINATYDPNRITTGTYYPYGDQATPYNGTSALSSTYNCFNANGFSAFGTTGVFTADPLFADQPNADYHLKSTAGRWNGSIFVNDLEDSPCIDAGDPYSSYANELEDNGDRINIGRYGNTAEASKSGGSAPLGVSYDNRMKDTTPTTVYSSNTFLDVGYNGSAKYRDLIYFDMTPYMDDSSASITDAKLSMYWYFPTTTRAADTVVQIMKPESGWTNDSVCWSNKASGTAWTYAGGDWTDSTGASQGTSAFASVTFPAGTTATNQYYDWNVTSLVQNIISGGVNSGMFIKASAETSANYIAFYGNANASNRPKLSITRIASQTEGTAASDNRLRQAAPATVYLTSTYNDVGYLVGTGAFRDIIWFDLTPFEDVETITSAKLSLYWYHPPTTRTNNTIVDIYRPASGWNKDYVCWNNKANGVAWTNAGGDWYDANSTAQGSTPYATYTFPGGTVATNQYYTFDVTALVNYYRSSGTNAGFFIKARTESDNYIGFYSLNNTDYKPKLEVTSTIQLP